MTKAHSAEVLPTATKQTKEKVGEVETRSFVLLATQNDLEFVEAIPMNRSLHGISTGEWDGYELLEEIGHGGMGVVYKARQKSLGRIVAIKVIRSDHVPQPSELERFDREILAAARLDHPGIVSVYDAGKHEGWPFYVMAYVPGSTLANRIKESPFSPPEATRIGHKIVESIAYAHRQGVIHRDLKPANVLMDDEDRPRITDFGLAKVMGPGVKLTASGVVLGSLPFIAPEQTKGRSELIGPASDVYALGAIMYTMLVGSPPFSDTDPVTLVRRITRDNPPAIRSLRPDVSPALESIIHRCLAKNPNERFATADELATALEQLLNPNQPPVAPSAIRQEKIPVVSGYRDITVSVTDDQQAIHQSNRFPHSAIIAFVATLAICLVAALVWMMV